MVARKRFTEKLIFWPFFKNDLQCLSALKALKFIAEEFAALLLS